jgi:outer membrane protein assembly factor BamA
MLRWHLVTAIICQIGLPVSPAPRSQTIVKITVSGNRLLNSEGIISASGLKVGADLTERAVEVARENLLSTGQFGADVLDRQEEAVKVVKSEVAGGIALTILVHENEVVKGINISGRGPIRPAEIQPLVKTRLGWILNLNTLRVDIQVIQQEYIRRGYKASVAGDEVRIEKGIVHIPITVGKIGFVRVGLLPEKLANEVRKALRVKPGDYYNLFTLEEGLRRAARICTRHGYLLDLTPQPIIPDGPAYSLYFPGASVSWSSPNSAVLTVNLIQTPKSTPNRSPAKNDAFLSGWEP